MSKNIVKNAWIITRESYQDKARVVSVLKYHKSENQIFEYITQLYVDSLHPSDIISFLKNKRLEGLPYKPKLRITKGRYVITIGHEPYFYARKVKNLRVNNEEFVWDE